MFRIVSQRDALREGNMHILIIPSWYKTEENPVKGSFFEEQARALNKRGHKVGVLNIQYIPFSSQRKRIFRQYDDEGIPTIQKTVKGIIPRNIPFNFWYIAFKGYKLFNEYVKWNGIPDVIHAHATYYGGIVARYISKKSGIPYIITEHYSPLITGNITDKNKIDAAIKVYKQASKSIIVSNTFQKDLTEKLNLSKDHFIVIPNLIAPLFGKNTKENEIEVGKPIIFFTNSFLTEIKNHKLMLDSYKIFRNNYEKTELVIGGDGMLANELKDYVKKIKLSDYVRFRGLLSRDEVKKQLDECHIFLSSSKYETFGVAMIEALAAGRPVITTDSGGPRDYIDSTNGVLVRSWDPNDYAESMKDMVKNYNSYDQRMISGNCLSKYSEKSVITQLVNVYKEVLESKSKTKERNNNSITNDSYLTREKKLGHI